MSWVIETLESLNETIRVDAFTPEDSSIYQIQSLIKVYNTFQNVHVKFSFYLLNYYSF